MNKSISELLPALLKTISDPADEVVLINLQVSPYGLVLALIHINPLVILPTDDILFLMHFWFDLCNFLVDDRCWPVFR